VSKITPAFYGSTQPSSSPLPLFLPLFTPTLSTPLANVDWCEEEIFRTKSSLCVRVESQYAGIEFSLASVKSQKTKCLLKMAVFWVVAPCIW
jgi:hypothetical protein